MEQGLKDNKQEGSQDSLEVNVEVRGVQAELSGELSKLAEECPECTRLDALKYAIDICRHNLGESERNAIDFGLTEPEAREYGVDEEYRFLVHVPVDKIEERFSRIGPDGRGGRGVLMTTLLSNERQGTFEGQGGFILSMPSRESIRGMSSVDCGGEIRDHRMDSLEEITESTDNAEYSQIDLAYDGTSVTGVMIKVDPEGKELGSGAINAELKRIAEERGLPVARVVVAPSELPTEIKTTDVKFGENGGLTTIDVPFDSNNFIRLNIATGQFEWTRDTTVSRTMLIDAYGQVNRNLSNEQRIAVRNAIEELLGSSQISQEQYEVVASQLSPVV